MASIREILEAPIPRSLIWVGAPILGLLMVLVFVFLGFPYTDLIPVASREIGRATGSQVEIGDIQPQITLSGPGFTFHDVRLVGFARDPIDLDYLAVRPAWSTSWLRGEPTFAIALAGPVAEAEGQLALGQNSGFNGELRIPDLARLPLPAGSPISLTGDFRAGADLVLAAGQPSGHFDFEANSGSATHPSLPMPLEFESLRGRIEVGAESWLELREIRLEGPFFSASADGSIERGADGRPTTIDIGVELEAANLPFKMLLSGLGLSPDSQGRFAFNLGGTLQNPVLR